MVNWLSLNVPSDALLIEPRLSVPPGPLNPAAPLPAFGATVGMQKFPPKSGHLLPGRLRYATATGLSPVNPRGNPPGKKVAIRFASERLFGSTGMLVAKFVPAAVPEAACVP